MPRPPRHFTGKLSKRCMGCIGSIELHYWRPTALCSPPPTPPITPPPRPQTACRPFPPPRGIKLLPEPVPIPSAISALLGGALERYGPVQLSVMSPDIPSLDVLNKLEQSTVIDKKTLDQMRQVRPRGGAAMPARSTLPRHALSQVTHGFPPLFPQDGRRDCPPRDLHGARRFFSQGSQQEPARHRGWLVRQSGSCAAALRVHALPDPIAAPSLLAGCWRT